jgi:hypothetical protein
MRIHDHLSQHIERATAAVKENRSRSAGSILSPLPEDTFAISEASALLQALRDEAAGPEREAHLESLRNSYAAGDFEVNLPETSQLMMTRGFGRIRE